MSSPIVTTASKPLVAVLVTNKVIRNTYTLLSMALLFSALTAAMSVKPSLPHPGLLITPGVYFGLLVMSAMEATGGIFLGLSLYTLACRRSLSFMGEFLLAGILMVYLAGLAALFFEMFGLSLVVTAMFVLLMAGLILYQTSSLIHGGKTNYIMASVTLYVTIFNLFSSLLHLLGFMNSTE